MRTRALAAGAIISAAVALVLAGVGVGSTSTRHASIHLVKASPVHIRGSGFHARERVRVVATAAHVSAAKRVRASQVGAFAVSFAFSAGRCSGLWVTAVGSAGSRARLKLPPLPACMPQ